MGGSPARLYCCGFNSCAAKGDTYVHTAASCSAEFVLLTPIGAYTIYATLNLTQLLFTPLNSRIPVLQPA